MASKTAKPIIFISYSHKDEPKNAGLTDVCWLTFVQSHLQPAVKHGIYNLWVDEDIPGGGKWREEITAKLNECDVCVLLVSRHSLASISLSTLRSSCYYGDTRPVKWKFIRSCSRLVL